MTNKFLFLGICLGLHTSLVAGDFGQGMTGQELEDRVSPLKKGNSFFLQGKTEDAIGTKGGDDSHFVPHEKWKSAGPKAGKGLEDLGNSYVPGNLGKPEKYVSFQNDELVKNFHGKGVSKFHLFYVRDGMDYNDNTDNIKNVFGSDDSTSFDSGMLFLGNNFYFLKGFASLTWGLNLGIGAKKGRGRFQSGNKSETTFVMWTLPLEILLGVEFDLGKYFELSIQGGGGAFGLWQSRNDRDGHDKDKHVKEIGFGPVMMGKFSLSLGGISADLGHSLYRSYEVSDCYLDLIVRYQEYDYFADDLTISGTSYGLGISFEFL